MNNTTKIKILGAGPTGSLLAISLAKVGARVYLYDPKETIEMISRSRAYALTYSSRDLLQSIGLWDELFEHLIPFKNRQLAMTSSNIEKRIPP